jgi:Ca-activated chloride channel family protein
MFNLQIAWDRPVKVQSQLSEHILRVRIVPAGERMQNIPLRLAIALDTSASMQGEKWERAKAATQALGLQLRPGDRLSLAGFADWVTPLAHNCESSQLGELPSVLNTLVAQGVTRTDSALHWIQSALSPEPGIARVGILITDGHPTNERGHIINNVAPIVQQAGAIAATGITICTVGLGNAADFNTAFLVSLSDCGRGAFLYAETPELLLPQLQERLQASQTVAVADAALKLNFAGGIRLKNCCQLHPDYLPLSVCEPQEIHLRNLRADTATDVLLALDVPALNASMLAGSYTIAEIQLQAPDLPPVTAQAPLKFTLSYQEAQLINQEVDRDRLSWDINRFSTELAGVSDPLQTGELLSQIQAAALKSGQIGIAEKATQQLDDLYKTGRLSAHQTTGLLTATRQLGGQ